MSSLKAPCKKPYCRHFPVRGPMHNEMIHTYILHYEKTQLNFVFLCRNWTAFIKSQTFA